MKMEMSLLVTQQMMLLGMMTTHARPIIEQVTDQAFARRYLSKFGYLSSPISVRSSNFESPGNAITKFQAFAGLKQTGELNEETVEYMRKRRCGVRDIGDDDNGGGHKETGLVISTRHKRYAIQGSRWRSRNKIISYRVTKYPTTPRLSQKDVDQTMKKAFDVWEKETNLEFEKKSSGDVHIEIKFETKEHLDNDPFDGFGGTLAHAFFPLYGGDVHFDDDEDWTVNSYRGTSLLMTASHELGHSLGLSHSNVKTSLMAPFYRGYEKNVELDADDISGIQILYGEKEEKNERKEDDDRHSVTSSPLPTPAFSTPKDVSDQVNNKDLCQGNKLDAMVTVKNGDTFAFLGNYYWKLNESSVEPGYPHQISEGWDGLPGNLDAAFTWTNGKTYFFKGPKYWSFSDVGVMDDEYPKNLRDGFEGVPDNIDAAMVWPVNNKIYFFKGSKYWKLDPDKKPSVAESYPRPIQNWEGIPDNLDSALNYSNGKTYFFKNGKYYRFDDQKRALDDSADPEYPRETGLWWFGCKSSPLVKQ